VSFFGGGIRYAFTGYGKLEPYVLGGAGAASVKRDVKFTAGGVDITSSLGSAPYYTVLGTDLTGTLTKPMFTAGGGVAYHATSLLRVDLGYRFARIMTDTSGTNVSRAGIGIGVTF
jgi:opacity protein-like surface antigen